MTNPETHNKRNHGEYPELGIPSAKKMRELAIREGNSWTNATTEALQIILERVKENARCGYFTAEFKHSNFKGSVKWHLIEEVLKENEYQIAWREDIDIVTVVCW